MTVRKLDKDKYVIDYYPTGRKGKRVRQIHYGSEAEARALEGELRRIHAGHAGEIINPKIIDILPEYYDWAALHYKPIVVRKMKYQFKEVQKFFGHMRFTQITPSMIDKYKAARCKKKVIAVGVNNELKALRSLIAFAVNRRYANPLPFKMENMRVQKKLPQIPHPAEIERFIEACDGRDAARKRAVLRLMWECGLRWNEASRIRWENINWESDMILLAEAKGNRQRFAMLTQNVKKILEPIRKSEGWVFDNPATGNPYTSFQTLFEYLRKKASTGRIYPHLLRHAFGTVTLEATGDLRAVQHEMGHADIESTQIYTHISIGRSAAIQRKRADYVSQSIATYVAENKRRTK